MLIPKIAKAKNSGLLNFNANLANTGEMSINVIALKMPPKTEAVVEIPKALPGCLSLTARGQPSNVVAADAGVPGVFKSIADIEPP